MNPDLGATLFCVKFNQNWGILIKIEQNMQYFIKHFGISINFPQNCASYEFEKVSFNLKGLQMTKNFIATLNKTLNLNE